MFFNFQLACFNDLDEFKLPKDLLNLTLILSIWVKDWTSRLSMNGSKFDKSYGETFFHSK